MKTSIRIFASVFAASLGLVSCNKVNVSDEGNGSKMDGVRTIAVSFANASVKSELGEDGFTPKFVGTDVIKVSNGRATEDCTVSIDDSGNAFITTSLIGALTAVYPSSAANMNGNAIEGIIVSTVQDGTFASANICKATIEEDASSATFENQTAIFKLTVPAKVDAKGVDYVAKSLKVISKNGNIADDSKEIKVGDGTSTIAADEKGFYYVSVLPGEISSNLYVCAGAGARNLTGDDKIDINKIYSVALPVLNGHEYVEITMTVGETSKTIKWATMNVGATKPEEYGLYFAWGDVVGRRRAPFDWVHTPFNNYSSKYDATYFSSVRNTVCPDDILAKEYDAAHVNWGGEWRMPKQEDFQALSEACGGSTSSSMTPSTLSSSNPDKGIYWVSEEQEHISEYTGVAGLLFCDGNGNSLFFPAAGYGYDISLDFVGSVGEYWSSSLDSPYPNYASYLGFNSSKFRPQYFYLRNTGMSVRPLSD